MDEGGWTNRWEDMGTIKTEGWLVEINWAWKVAFGGTQELVLLVLQHDPLDQCLLCRSGSHGE